MDRSRSWYAVPCTIHCRPSDEAAVVTAPPQPLPTPTSRPRDNDALAAANERRRCWRGRLQASGRPECSQGTPQAHIQGRSRYTTDVATPPGCKGAQAQAPTLRKGRALPGQPRTPLGHRTCHSCPARYHPHQLLCFSKWQVTILILRQGKRGKEIWRGQKPAVLR